MITYKNLRDVKTAYDDKLYDRITTLTVDVYEANIILGWFKHKGKFIKTIKLIRVYNTWWDLDDEYLPVYNTSQLESLLNKYESSIRDQKFKDLVIEAIKSYK